MPMKARIYMAMLIDGPGDGVLVEMASKHDELHLLRVKDGQPQFLHPDDPGLHHVYRRDEEDVENPGFLAYVYDDAWVQ